MLLPSDLTIRLTPKSLALLALGRRAARPTSRARERTKKASGERNEVGTRVTCEVFVNSMAGAILQSGPPFTRLQYP